MVSNTTKIPPSVAKYDQKPTCPKIGQKTHQFFLSKIPWLPNRYTQKLRRFKSSAAIYKYGFKGHVPIVVYIESSPRVDRRSLAQKTGYIHENFRLHTSGFSGVEALHVHCVHFPSQPRVPGIEPAAMR